MSPQFPVIRTAKHISLLLLFAWTVARAATVPIPEHGITLVAFGDSTTAPREGLEVYSELLEKQLKARLPAARVINAGVRGNNTKDATRRFQKDVLDHKPDLVVLQFGINDSAVDVWKQPPADKPRIGLTNFRNHLQYLVSMLRARGVKVVLMTPNPLRWTPRLRELYGKSPYHPEDPEGMNQLLHTYVAAVRELAHQEHVALVDVDEAFRTYAGEHGSLDDLLLDGMHPNQQGQSIVAELLGKTVMDLLALR
jgi:lysophospholipase L1-like esterase